LVDQNINTNITATANFTSLTAQLQAVTSELIKLQTTTLGLNQKLNAQIGQMNRSFVDTMRSTGQFSSHFVTLSSDVDKFGKNLASGRMKLSEYYNTWQSHAKKTSTIVKDLAKQQVMLQNSVVQPLGRNAQGLMQYNVMVARGLDENKNKMQLLRQEQAIMNRVMQDGSNQLINWGKNTQWAGRQLTVGLTVPLAAFGAAASRAFLTADAELVRLTKVYGGLTQTSAEDLAKIRKDIAATAKELAVQYGASYKDSIALSADLAATGLQGRALVSATKETTRLATLGEVDRQDAMKATLAIQNAFKQSTEELTQSIDFLNAVENQTSTSLGDLVEAIPKAGPVIKSLGGDVKDLALYLTAMKEGGVNASEGANAIKSALASLINPTKVAKEMFTGFGIDLAGIVSSNAGDLTGTIMSLQKALDSLDPLSKSKAIEQLFGKFQFARMSALFENLGKQGSQTLQVLDLMKASTQDLANISAREMKQMTESASGQYKRALESVKADMAAAGESFLKISTFVLKAIDGIVKFITDLPGPIKSILTFVGGLTALAGPLIMLTGVLGNFFGYIVKGIFNLKQFFKGGSAFKLLTPEIMAAEAAAKAVGDSFYSDAKAAKVFEDAVLGLSRSFEILQTKAAMATRATHSSVNMSTLGGGIVTTGAGSDRVVNKDSQYLGKPYSRDMSHTIPSGEEQLGTIFGVVPGTGPVNRKISNNPQMYMDGDLPRIPGITSVNSVSTGIVASEAARWHAMTAAIAMQSKEELALLRQEVAATGTVTTQLSSSYSAMLPPMVELTSLAAAEGAAIVAQLQQGKITVDQARAKIIALNQTVEAMMAETAQMTAATMGRTVNLTTVPLTSQPTVDPVTGKSNMKEMFHKGSTKTLVDRIARALGVRTSGGGYSTETTLPIVRKNDGGMVYDPSRHGSVVPGPANVNYDIIPARLPEGSYILNQQASRNNPDLVGMAQNKYSGGGRVVNALLTPKETYFDPEFTAANKPLLDKANSGSRIELRNTGGMLGGLVTRGIKNYGNIAIDSTDPVTKFIQYYAGSDREDLRLAAVAADASTLRSLGLPTDDAIFEATKWFDDRWRETLSLNDGVFSQDIFNQITTDDLPKFEKRLRKQEKYRGKLHKKRLSMPVKTRNLGGASLTRKDWQYVGPTSAYEKIASRNEVLEAMAASSSYEKEKVTRLIAAANRFGDGPNNGVQVAHFTPGSSPNTPVAGIDHLGRAALQPWEINQIQDSLSSYGIFSSDFSLDPAENISMLDRAAMEHGYADHKDMLNKILSRDTSPATKNTMRTSRGLTTTMQAVLDKKPKEFRGWLANRAMLMSKFKIRQAANAGGLIGGLVKRGKHGYGNESPAALRLKAFAAAQQIRRDAEHKKNLEKFPWIKPQIDAYRNSQKDPLFLGMPRSFKKVQDQRKARLTMEEIDFSLKTSQFANMDPTDFGVLQKASSGHSFPVEGIAGVYKKPDGSIVFVKPVMHETEALAEQRATTIARGAHELGSPTQEIRTMIDPTDPNKKRKLIVLESKYDPIFDQANNGVFSQEEYFKQIVAANLRGDRDLSRDNIQGSLVNDVGTSGVFKMASSAQGKREYYGEMVDGTWVDGMPSMSEQARINLLGVKGGAKRFFAESTLSVPKGMTASAYHEAMIAEIDSVLPRLRQVISDMNLNATERQIYGAMIKRLEDGRLVNWEEFHAIHSAVKPSPAKALTPAALLKLKTEAELRMRQRGHAVSLSDNSFKSDANGFNAGGMIEARENGGPVNSGQPYLVGEKGPEIFVPKNDGGIVSNYALGGMVRSNKTGYGDQFIGPQPYGVRSAFSAGLRGVNTKTGASIDTTGGMGASMAGMGLMMGGQGVGGTMGSAMTNAGMAMQMYPMLKMIGPHIKGLTTMTGVITKLGVIGPRVFNAIGLAIKFMTGPIGIALMALTSIFAAFKFAMAQQKEFKQRELLTNAISVNGAKEAGIKYNNLSDSIKVVNEQLAATKARGMAAYESLTKIGVIGITYTIKETKAAIRNAKTNKKELVQGFSDIDDSYNMREQQVLDMATNLKIQMVLGGKSVQDATNEIYALISASTNASLAFKTITADSFVTVKDKATAATEAIDKLNTNIDKLGKNGSDAFYGEVLGTALSNVVLYMDSSMKALVGTKDEFGNVIDQAEAYRITMEKINSASARQGTLTKTQVESLKETHPHLEEILTTSDSIASTMAKWQLLLAGVDVDLKNMSAAEAIAMGEFVAIQQSALDAMEKTGVGILGKSEKIISKLKLTIGKGLEAAQKAHNKNMVNAEDEIKAIDKKIAKINEEAEARKRALQDIENVESNALQMQLLQIDYQAALATGDMDAAASAQIKITQLEKQIQTAAALQAIEDKRIADVKKEEARKKSIQDEAEKSAKRLAALQEAASLNQIRLSKIQEYQLRYEQLIKDKMALSATPQRTDAEKEIYALAEKRYIGNVKLLGTNLEADAKGKDKSLSGMIQDIFGGTFIGKDGSSLATVNSGLKYDSSVSPTPITTYGTAFDNINAAAKETGNIIKGLGGGKTLYDLYYAVMDGHRSARTAIAAKGTYATWKDSKTGDLGVLTSDARKQIVADNAITAGEFFHFNGWIYRLDASGNVIRGNRVPGSRIETGDQYGRVTAKASGGYIRGEGTATSDSIPAYLSNGEYVIKASSVAKYGTGTFDALNAGKFAQGGPVGKLGTASSMIETAESMLGYREGRNNDTIFGRFAQKVYDLKTKYIAWCGAFINWVAKKSGVDLASMVWTPGGAQSFKSTGKWTQNPVRGDLAFMNFPGDGVNRISHVGLVRNVLSKNAVSTIEGNTGSSGNQRMGGGVFIKRRKYNEKGAPIVGFGRPSYKPIDVDEENVDTDNVKYQTSDQAKLNYENSRYTVKRGDTLSAISKKYGIPLKSLIEMNPHLNDPKYKGGSKIFAGTELSIKKFASGGRVTDYLTPDGYIRGAGTATSDSIPAMLSNGEYVIKADSVKKYGAETFDALNAQKFGTGGLANLVAPKPFGQLKPAINSDTPFGRIVQGLLSYLGNLPKDIITSGISGSKYMAGAATGNPNWMDPKDEKMYQQALRDKENGKYFKSASSVMGRFATSAVDVIPKLVNWNKLWAKAGMKDLPGQTEYLLAQLPGEVIQDLLKNIIPGNYAEGGLAKNRKSGIPRFHGGGFISDLFGMKPTQAEIDKWMAAAKKDLSNKDAGSKDFIVGNTIVDSMTTNEANVSKWIHAWGALLNTYYGAKYDRHLKAAGDPGLLKNPILTNLQVTHPRNIASYIGGYDPGYGDIGGHKLGVAGNMATFGDLGQMMLLQPATTAGLGKQAWLPEDGANKNTYDPTFESYAPGGPKGFDVKKYSDFINGKLLTDDSYKMSLLSIMFHEYGHNLQYRLANEISGKNTKSKLFKNKDGSFMDWKDTTESNADFLSGSIMSEMYNAGYMKDLSSKSVTKYLQKQYASLATPTDKGIEIYDSSHPKDNKQRFDLYLRGFRTRDTDLGLADYLGQDIGTFIGDSKHARETVQRLLNFEAKPLNVNDQNMMPDLLNKEYADLLKLQLNPTVRTLPTPSTKKLDIKTPTQFAKALIQRLGGEPTEGLASGIRAWIFQEGGHWNNKALYNPLNTTLEMPGSKKVNTVNKKTGTGVQAYTSWEQGIDAVIKTLSLNPQKNGYDKIVEALTTGTRFGGPEKLYTALNNSNWGYPKYNFGKGKNQLGYGQEANYNPNTVYDPSKPSWYSLPNGNKDIPLDPSSPGTPGGWGSYEWLEDLPNYYQDTPDLGPGGYIPDGSIPGGGRSGQGLFTPQTQDIDWVQYAYPANSMNSALSPMSIPTIGTKTLLAALDAVKSKRVATGVSISNPTNAYDIFRWGGSEWAQPKSLENTLYGFRDGARYNLQGTQYAEGTVTNVIDRPGNEKWNYWPNGSIGKNYGPLAFANRSKEDRYNNILENWFLSQNGETGFKNGSFKPFGKNFLEYLKKNKFNIASPSGYANGGYVTRYRGPVLENVPPLPPDSSMGQPKEDFREARMNYWTPGYSIPGLGLDGDGASWLPEPFNRLKRKKLLNPLSKDKIQYADGGYVNPSYSANLSIPKFENGINMVPADMLALLHKNEAVIPAVMNPFNPNANGYDIKSGSEYNINVTLNGNNLSPDDVARAISREMQLRDAMAGRSRNK